MTRRSRDTCTSLCDIWTDADVEPAALPVPALLAEPVPDALGPGSVRCLACAHRCLIRPGRSGICGVRRNEAGRLVSCVYGDLVAATAEPIEKKPLFHAFPGSLAYSVSTIGCNFHCAFCQNWLTSQAELTGQRPPGNHMDPERCVDRARATGARTIAYTYVEPTVFIEYVIDTARRARAAGLGNVLVTNGYQTIEALDLLAPLIDAANVDLKAFTDWFYRQVCGARLAPVLAALAGMRERGIWLEVTTLLIDGLNDDPRELEQLAAWIVRELGADTPWHVARAYPAYRMPDIRPTPIEAILRTIDIGRAAGLRHVYAGNVGDRHDQDTHCAACGRTLIRRRTFGVVANDLRDGACPACGTALAGIGLRERAA
jgi:pyruvate formate lyase activating enzyme